MLRSTILSNALAVAIVGLATAGWAGAAFAGESNASTDQTSPAALNGSDVELAKGVALKASDDVKLLDASAPIRVNVVLNMHNKAELRETAEQVKAGLVAPLTDQELASRYLPGQAEAKQVHDYLASKGFSTIYISKNNLIVTATGTVANVQSAFKTRVYSLHRGKLSGVANADPIAIPAALSGVVSAVHGLQSFNQRGLPAATRATTATGANVTWHGVGAPGTQAAAGTPVACRECVHAPYDFPLLYNSSNLAPASNQSIAVIEEGDQGNTTYLYQTWASDYGFSNIPLTITYPTGYTSGDFSAQLEAALDVDAIATMAGSLSNIAIYSSPSYDLGDELTAVDAAITSDNQKIVSLSYAASCDADIPQDLRDSWDSVLSAGVAKGITVFSVTQDDGGYPGCADNESSTGFPASSPFVVSVGASTIYNTADSYNTYDHEDLWIGSESGPAATETRPSYQSAVAGIVGPNRGTPDFVMDGDPNSGIWVINGGYDSTGTYQTEYEAVGGTSLAAPLLAGSYALILQSGVPPYFWQQTYYDIGVGQVNHSINDCFDCYNSLVGGSNGAWSVVPGQFNLASGWGSWNVGNLAGAMRYQR